MQTLPRHTSTFAALAAAMCCYFSVAAQTVPESINHQGYIEVDGQPFTGNGAFRFAIVDASGNNLWTHDSSGVGTTNMPASSLSLSVNKGMYSAALGDGTATDAFPAGLFRNHSGLSLRVWFDDGTNSVQRLAPDKPVRHVPYANVAKTAQTTATVPNVITVDRVDYHTPREHILRIPPAAFQTAINGTSKTLTFDHIFSEGSGQLYAPVMLPDGATMTEMRAIYEDEDSDSQLSFVLRSVEINGDTDLLAAVTTADESGVVETPDSSSLPHTVDNDTYSYMVYVGDDANDWGPNPNFTTRVIAVEISYTLGGAL